MGKSITLAEQQVRTLELRGLTIQEPMSDQPAHIRGYAAVFDQQSEPLMRSYGTTLREVIHRGAFAKTLKEADVRATIDHDPRLLLGRNKSGTLEMHEDAHGLAVDITLPDTTYARDLMECMKRGDKNQMSFQFVPVKRDVETIDDQATGTRTIVWHQREVRLSDVSVVTYPAYTQTQASVRSLMAADGIDVEPLPLADSVGHSEQEPTVTPDSRSHSGDGLDWQAALAAKKREIEILEMEN